MFHRMKLPYWLLLVIASIFIYESKATFKSSSTATSNNAVLGQIPYQASIREENRIHYCGGAIISERWIVTSGKCIAGKSPKFVMVGSVTKSGGTQYSVGASFVHPFYQSNFLWNDIGLIRTTENIIFDNNVSPVELAKGGPGENDNLTVSGWGTMQNNQNENLQVIKQTVMPYYSCMFKVLPMILKFSQICTVGAGFCSTDSGAPVVNNKTLYGVASYVTLLQGCIATAPDVSTKISKHKAWIKIVQTFNKK